MTVMNRKTFRRVAALATLAAAGVVSGVALAGPHGHGGHGGHERGGMGMGMSERMLDAVEATPEQRTQIQQITQAARTDMQAQREASQGLREQLRSLFTQPTVDANAVEALRQQMLAQHDQASQRMTQVMLEVSRVLTPAQREKIAERMQQHSARWQERREARQPGAAAQSGAPKR
ncbi:MAG: periplasmic heavy metal sensor [Rubrivivax sp.]